MLGYVKPEADVLFK